MKNLLYTEEDKNFENTSNKCEEAQTKAINLTNNMATREYVTRNKAKEPYSHTSLSQTQKRQKKDTSFTEQQQQKNRDRSRDPNA